MVTFSGYCFFVCGYDFRKFVIYSVLVIIIHYLLFVIRYRYLLFANRLLYSLFIICYLIFDILLFDIRYLLFAICYLLFVLCYFVICCSRVDSVTNIEWKVRINSLIKTIPFIVRVVERRREDGL